MFLNGIYIHTCIFITGDRIGHTHGFQCRKSDRINLSGHLLSHLKNLLIRYLAGCQCLHQLLHIYLRPIRSHFPRESLLVNIGLLHLGHLIYHDDRLQQRLIHIVKRILFTISHIVSIFFRLLITGGKCFLFPAGHKKLC